MGAEMDGRGEGGERDKEGWECRGVSTAVIQPPHLHRRGLSLAMWRAHAQTQAFPVLRYQGGMCVCVGLSSGVR